MVGLNAYLISSHWRTRLMLACLLTECVSHLFLNFYRSNPAVRPLPRSLPVPLSSLSSPTLLSVSLHDSLFSDFSETELVTLRVLLTAATNPSHSTLPTLYTVTEPTLSTTPKTPSMLPAKRQSLPSPRSVSDCSTATLPRRSGSMSLTSSVVTCTKPVVQ